MPAVTAAIAAMIMPTGPVAVNNAPIVPIRPGSAVPAVTAAPISVAIFAIFKAAKPAAIAVTRDTIVLLLSSKNLNTDVTFLPNPAQSIFVAMLLSRAVIS